jgi:hypothetical protein
MRLSISMIIFQKFAVLEIIEFLVNLWCAKIYPDTVFSSIPKFQLIFLYKTVVAEWYQKNEYYSFNIYVKSKKIARENVERDTINNCYCWCDAKLWNFRS